MDFFPSPTAALVGASKSGESTIVSMIERFYDPESGIVRLDSFDIQDLNVAWLHQQIGLTQQEPSLSIPSDHQVVQATVSIPLS